MSPPLLLRIEGALVFVGAVLGYALLGASWWLFALLLLAPDVFMVGYVRGPRIGALVYNAGHTLLGPFLLGGWSLWTGDSVPAALALIWTAHIGLDRAFGFGLKLPTAFGDTHLAPATSTPSTEM